MSTHLIREARKRAGLTQRELAERLNTHQPTIARWERGSSKPGFHDVKRAVAACGFDLNVSLTPRDDHDLALIRRELGVLPHLRLSRMIEAVNQTRAMQDAGHA